MSTYGFIDGVPFRSNGIYAVCGRATNMDFLSTESDKSSTGSVVYYVKPMVSNISTSKDSAKNLSEVERTVTELSETMNSFDKESVELESLFEKTQRFVKNYNAVLDSTKEVSSLSLKREAQKLVDFTKENAGSFAKIGISITNTGSLQMDEDKFKQADENTVKDMFIKKETYGEQIETRIAILKDSAKRELVKSNTYNRLGEYTNNYNYSLDSYI